MLSRKVLLVLALSAGSACAAPVKILGFDDMSCEAWVKSAQDKAQRELYVVWVNGFLTGHNYAHQKAQVATISRGTVELNVDRYCRDHPKGQFGDAAMRLSDRFSGRNEPISK